jgi:hypothetical protein
MARSYARQAVFGDNPQGYLVYMPDGHVFVQIRSPRERAS